MNTTTTIIAFASAAGFRGGYAPAALLAIAREGEVEDVDTAIREANSRARARHEAEEAVRSARGLDLHPYPQPIARDGSGWAYGWGRSTVRLQPGPAWWELRIEGPVDAAASMAERWLAVAAALAPAPAPAADPATDPAPAPAREEVEVDELD